MSSNEQRPGNTKVSSLLAEGPPREDDTYKVIGAVHLKLLSMQPFVVGLINSQEEENGRNKGGDNNRSGAVGVEGSQTQRSGGGLGWPENAAGTAGNVADDHRAHAALPLPSFVSAGVDACLERLSLTNNVLEAAWLRALRKAEEMAETSPNKQRNGKAAAGKKQGSKPTNTHKANTAAALSGSTSSFSPRGGRSGLYNGSSHNLSTTLGDTVSAAVASVMLHHQQQHQQQEGSTKGSCGPLSATAKNPLTAPDGPRRSPFILSELEYIAQNTERFVDCARAHNTLMLVSVVGPDASATARHIRHSGKFSDIGALTEARTLSEYWAVRFPLSTDSTFAEVLLSLKSAGPTIIDHTSEAKRRAQSLLDENHGEEDEDLIRGGGRPSAAAGGLHARLHAQMQLQQQMHHSRRADDETWAMMATEELDEISGFIHQTTRLISALFHCKDTQCFAQWREPVVMYPSTVANIDLAGGEARRPEHSTIVLDTKKFNGKPRQQHGKNEDSKKEEGTPSSEERTHAFPIAPAPAHRQYCGFSGSLAPTDIAYPTRGRLLPTSLHSKLLERLRARVPHTALERSQLFGPVVGGLRRETGLLLPTSSPQLYALERALFHGEVKSIADGHNAVGVNPHTSQSNNNPMSAVIPIYRAGTPPIAHLNFSGGSFAGGGCGATASFAAAHHPTDSFRPMSPLRLASSVGHPQQSLAHDGTVTSPPTAVGETLIMRERTLPPAARDEQQQNPCPLPLPIDELWISHQSDVAHDLWSVGVISLEWMLRLAFSKPTLGTDLKDAILVFLGGNTTFATPTAKKSRLGGRVGGGADSGSLPNSGNKLFNAHQSGGIPENAPFEVPFTIAHTAAHQRLQYTVLKLMVATINRCAEAGGTSSGDALNTSLSGAGANSSSTSFAEGIGSSPRRRRRLSGWAGALPMPSIGGVRGQPRGSANLTPPPSQHQSANARRNGSFSKGKGDASPFSSALHVGESRGARGMPPTPSSYANLHLYAGRTSSNNNSFAGEPEDPSSPSSSSVVNLRDPHTLAQHILRVLDILSGDTLSKGAIENVFTSLLLWRSEDRWKWFESSVVTQSANPPDAFSAEQERPTACPTTTEADVLYGEESCVAVTKAGAEKPISSCSPIAPPLLLSLPSPSPLGSQGSYSPICCCVPFVCDELSVRPSALDAITTVAAATAASLGPMTATEGVVCSAATSARSDTVYMDSIRSIRNSAAKAFPIYRLDLKALLTTFKTQVERTASAEHGHLHLRDVRQYHMFIEYLKLTSASAESIATVEATLHSAAVKEASIMLARATRAMIKERERAQHLETGSLADPSSPQGSSQQQQGANNGPTETKKKSGSFIKSFFSFTSKSSSSKKKEEDAKRSHAETNGNNGNSTGPLIRSFNSSSMRSNRYSDPAIADSGLSSNGVDSLFSTPNTSFSGLPPRDTGNNGGLLLTSPRSDGSLSPLMLLSSPDRHGSSPQTSSLRIAEEAHNATIALLHSLAVGGGAGGAFGKTRSGGGGLRFFATGGSSSYDGKAGAVGGGGSFHGSESSASTAAERAKAFAQAAFGDSSLVSIANILSQSSETARACAALQALAFLRERDFATTPRASNARVANQSEGNEDSDDDGGAFHNNNTRQERPNTVAGTTLLGFVAQNNNVSFGSPFTSFAGGNACQPQALGGVWRINSPLHGPSYSAAFLAPNIYADYSSAAAANGIPFLLNGVGNGVGGACSSWPAIATAAQNNPFANPMHFQPADYARDTLIIRARDVAEALPAAMKAWRKKQAGTGVSVHTSLLECFGVPQANVAASTSTMAPLGACGGGGSGGQRRSNRGGGVGGNSSGSAANGGFLLPGYAGSTRAEDKKKQKSDGLSVDDGLNNDASINNDQKKKSAAVTDALSSISSSSDVTDGTSSTRSSASLTSPTRNGDDEHSIQASRRRHGSQYRSSTKEDEHDEDEDDEQNPMKSPAIAALESRRGRRLLTVLREETPFPPALLATLREFIMNPFVDEEGFSLALAHVREALAEAIKAEEKKDLAANIRHSVWNRHVPIVPPALRALCWAKLLSLPLHDRHLRIDAPFHSVNTYHTMGSDRQIAVDVPRCHQYHYLLASVEGHRKLHHVCKAWLALHPAYVYWQGVDSIAAVILTAAFNDPPLAAATLGAIVDRYVPHYYNKERTMDQQLHTYTHVLTYADPDLALHLESLEVKPELYTISWFLTLFAHILPCEKVYLIWDRLFRSRSMGYTVCVAAALMSQMREGIMGSDFSGCVSLLSNSALQGVVDVARAAADADALLCSIPSTVLSPRYDVAMGALVRTSVCAMIEASELAQAYSSRADRGSSVTSVVGTMACWRGEGENGDDEEHESEESDSGGLYGLSDDVAMLSAECGMKKAVARRLITRLGQVKAICSRRSLFVRLSEEGQDAEGEETGNDDNEDDLDALFSDFVTVKYSAQKRAKRKNSNSNSPHRLLGGPHWADAGVFIIDVRTDDEIRGRVGGGVTFDLSPSISVENVSSADGYSTTAGTRNRSSSATLSQATTTTTAAAGAGFAAVSEAERTTTTAPQRHAGLGAAVAGGGQGSSPSSSLANTAIVGAIHHPYDGIDGWDVDAVIRSLCDRSNLWLPPVEERGVRSVDGVPIAAANPNGALPGASSPETEAFVRQQTEASPLQTFLASAPHVVIVAGKDPEAGQSAAQSLITNGTACVSMLLGGVRELKRVAPHLVVCME